METPGSQSSLHRANLRAGRARGAHGGLADPGGDRPEHRAVRGHRLQHRARAEGRRDGRGHAAPRRAAAGRAASRSAGTRASSWASTSATTHLRVAVGNLAHQVLAEEAEPIDVDASAAAGLRPGGAAGRPADRDHRHRRRTRSSASVSACRGRSTWRPARSARPRSCRAGRASTRAEELAGRLGVPVHVDNDANLGALGELVWGAGAGSRDLAYIKVASGVGAGLVIRRADLPRARAARRARSGTSRWTSPARCAAAATAAAWRPSPRPVRPAAAAPSHGAGSDHGAHGAAGPRRRPRLPPGHRRRRAAHRQRCGQSVQSAQPEPGGARRRSRRGR